MKTDDLTTSKVTPIRQDALPELSTIRSALDNSDKDAAVNAAYDRIDTINAEYAKTALEIANAARDEWNRARMAEVSAAKSLQSDDIQSQMASEIFAAFMTYLKTIPSGVQMKVIAKFHAINLLDDHKGVITL